jgi:hypothetical protein
MTPRELQSARHLRSVILTSGDTFWIENAWLASPGPDRQELPRPLQILSRIRREKSLKPHWLIAREESLAQKVRQRDSEFPDRRWARKSSS